MYSNNVFADGVVHNGFFPPALMQEDLTLADLKQMLKNIQMRIEEKERGQVFFRPVSIKSANVQPVPYYNFYPSELKPVPKVSATIEKVTVPKKPKITTLVD